MPHDDPATTRRSLRGLLGNGRDPRFRAAAGEVAGDLAAHGVGLVYGGAHVGLMGVVADAALAAGGKVIGVIPREAIARSSTGA